MSAELVAILCLFAFLVIAMIIAVRKLTAKEQHWLGLIDSLRTEFEAKVHEGLQNAIDTFAESFQNILGEPTIKKAFGIIGKAGGEAKAEGLVVDQMAGDILNSPQFAGIIAGAEMLGLDINDYIEKHGAVKTIAAAQQLSKLVGVDLMKFDMSQLQSLARPGGSSQSGENPYIRR